MNKNKAEKFKKTRRSKRTRSKIAGSKERPRISVFRSLKDIYVQLIDDAGGKTLASASSREMLKSKIKNQKSKIENSNNGKIEAAYKAGELIAKRAIEKGIKQAVFDRRGYKYHGRVAAVAEGARAAGLKF